METQSLYIEIPQRRPPSVYFASEQEIVEFSHHTQSNYLEENFIGITQYGDAVESIGHDLHTFHRFVSTEEAIEYYKRHKGHQYLAVITKLEQLQTNQQG